MKQPIRILHLEDDPADRELIRANLDAAGLKYEITDAQTGAEFDKALRQGGYDVILADFRLPMYDGMSALRLAQELYPDVPFIFVSGTMGEDAAIECLTEGATDYVLKQKLSRLVPAIMRALNETKNQRKRREAEKALKASEEKYIDLYDHAPDMYMSVNAKTTLIEECNQTLADTLGRPKNAIIGRPVFEIYHPDCLDDVKVVFQEFLKQGEIRDKELQLGKIDGSKLDVSLNVSAVCADDGSILHGRSTLRDITERKRSEESIRKLSQAIDQSPIYILITDVDGKIEFVNAQFTRVTGYAYDEAIGQTPRLLKSGETSDKEYSRLWETITSGGIWQGEFHNRKKNGELFWESATIAPVRNKENVITHFVAVKEDITKRKKLEEQLRQSQKMEAIGQLAGGVAHDLNNMLGVVIGYTELTLNKIDDDTLREYFETILVAARRSTEITQQLLTFARKQVIKPKIIDLNETVEEMLKLLRRLIGEDINLFWLPGPDLWTIKMDPTQIDQILANLCVNARDAITGVGKITIETKNTDLTDAHFAERKGFFTGEHVLLAVSDNGHGMDKQTVDKIFEPFFTTKSKGKGTGLGLSTVFGIVQQNDGFINVHSEPGLGSTFKIYLPRHIVKGQQMQEKGSAVVTAQGFETILLVEDDAMVLMMVREMLNQVGYTVLTASTPGDAIRIAKERSGRIELLITDVIMPGMTGRELEKKLSALCPGLKCLYMSGYTGDVIAHRGVLDEGIHFIQKPFSNQELAFKLREVLEGGE